MGWESPLIVSWQRCWWVLVGFFVLFTRNSIGMIFVVAFFFFFFFFLLSKRFFFFFSFFFFDILISPCCEEAIYIILKNVCQPYS